MESQNHARAALTVLLLALGCGGDDAGTTPHPDASSQVTADAGAAGGTKDGGASAEAGGPSDEPRDAADVGTGSGDAGAGGGGTREAGTDASGMGSRDAGLPGPSADAGASTDAGSQQPGSIWRPAAGTRWQWDLSGKITKLDVAADVYDIDLFENDADVVSRLHAMGKKVICYVSVGTYEPARPDAKDFPKAVLGKYWPEWDETYIDIRSEGVRAVMKKRLDMCKSKGFDGIEPDNMDMFEGGQSDTGFPLTEADGVAYAKWLAQEAHARGLSIGQKNTSSITDQIESLYDWALTEDCFADGWCNDMKAYPAHDKAMFMCEYTDTDVDFAAACSAAKTQKFSPILKKRELDSWIEFCK